MFVFSCGGGVSVWQNKKPHRRLAVGFDKSCGAIRTQLPRGATAARSATGSDSNYGSQVQSNGANREGQIIIQLCCNNAIQFFFVIADV